MRGPGRDGPCATEGHPSLLRAGGEGLVNTSVSCHITHEADPTLLRVHRGERSRWGRTDTVVWQPSGYITTRVTSKMAAGNIAPGRGSSNRRGT